MRLHVLALVLLAASPAQAQTVRDIANRGACSTAGVEALSQQLADEQMCLRPSGFVRFAPHPNITLSSSRVHPYAQASAANAIRAAADSQALTINSAFRTLADQYVLYHSGGCGLAARPGRSNHQSGRAIDVQNYSSARSSLTGAGCAWFGSSDAVHFDCPGSDMRSDSVRAFQRLWNRNNPSDMIAEDGIYGPQTEARLGQTPAGGFSTSGCEPMSCTARCEGDGFVDASCQRTSCGADQVCESDGGPRCVTPMADPGGSAIGAVYVDAGEGPDEATRIPMATVRVAETSETVTADANGVFRLAIGAGTYTLEASAEGYQTERRTCVVESGPEPTWCSIGLPSVMMAAGTLRGVVYDRDRGIQQRVIDARVTLSSGESADVVPEDGSFGFELPPGEYTVEAGGEGIAPGAATCLVVADDTTWCSVGVRADGPDGLNTVTVEDAIPDNGSGMPDERDGPGRDTVGGCAASAGGAASAPGGLGLLLLLALVGLRRRRR